MLDLPALIQACAPTVSPVLMQALVRTESAFNPYAIGLDAKQGGAVKQPASLAQAIRTAKALKAQGKTFSVGLSQIHVSNLPLYGLNWEQAFEACSNLATGQKILWNFYYQATASGYRGVAAVWAALRGYNSGDVHPSISDAYVNKIFAYMSQQPAAVSLAPSAPLPAAGQGPEKLSASRADARAAQDPREGESLEIFEKETVRQGF